MSSGGVMLTGWLRKSPPENKLKSRHHSWKKRWFVLKSGRLTGDPNVLEYSKYTTSKRPIKIIDLNDCKQIDANVNIPVRGDKKDKDANNHFIFSIVTSHRTFYLIADSKREMSSWVQCLCDLCGFNYDAAAIKDSFGDKKKTFTASPTSVVVHSPGGTVTAPTISNTACQNGTVNTSYRHTSNTGNGYDDKDQRTSRRDYSNDGITHYHNNFASAPTVVLEPANSVTSTDNTEYLHLVDCETAQGSTLPLIDKLDQRRCSNDSVFTHEESNPVDDVPDMRPLAPRFLEGGRLDSMPNVPPPAPPIGVDNLGRLEFDDDDEDMVVEARRPSKFMLNRGVYGAADLNLLPNTSHNAPYDSNALSQGRSGSFGSGTHTQSSDYINTLNTTFSSSMCIGNDQLDSPFSASDAHSIASSVSSRIMQEHTFPNSPVFPILHNGPHSEAKSVLHSEDDAPLREYNPSFNLQDSLKKQQLKCSMPDQMPPARPPKPTDLTKDNPSVRHHVSNGVLNSDELVQTQQGGGKPVFEPEDSLLTAKIPAPTSSSPSSSSINVTQWKSTSPVSYIRNEVQAPVTSNAPMHDALKPTMQDTPKALRPPPLNVSDAEADEQMCAQGSNLGSEGNTDIDDLLNPGYEKMWGGGCMNPNPAYNDLHSYTPMAGGGLMGPQIPPSSIGMFGLTSLDSTKPSPPPVHRDLKPGRKSLGSDGGSSQSGQEMRRNSGRDSCTSDEGLSPPHTIVVPSPHLSASPNQNNGTWSSWHMTHRPMRSSTMGNLPQSPLVSPNPSHPTKSPVHSSMRHPEKVSMAPERPPKPLSMKYPPEENRPPPRRPPKPGDPHSVHNRIHAMPSAIVVPPAAEDHSDVKYIEILTPELQRTNPIRVTHPAPEKGVDNDLVEYTHIDASRTRALEIMKKERQGKMSQKTNPD